MMMWPSSSGKVTNMNNSPVQNLQCRPDATVRRRGFLIAFVSGYLSSLSLLTVCKSLLATPFPALLSPRLQPRVAPSPTSTVELISTFNCACSRILNSVAPSLVTPDEFLSCSTNSPPNYHLSCPTSS